MQNAGRNLGHTRQAGRFQQASLGDFQLLLGLLAGRNLGAQFLIALLQFQRPLAEVELSRQDATDRRIRNGD